MFELVYLLGAGYLDNLPRKFLRCRPRLEGKED